MSHRLNCARIQKLSIQILFINSSKRCYSEIQKNISARISTGYKPREVEKDKHLKWAKLYSKERLENDAHKPKFSMVLPPPNVTGYLHLGHALMATIQDVICRRRRQQGYNVVWIPGTDHAGIATQVVVEKKLLQEQNKTRHQLGREQFLKEVWQWKVDKEDHIIDDLMKLGCSLDWNNFYFTMDKKQEKAVTEAFIRLFDEGLIKREKSLVNWSCSLESTVSDIEVQNKEIKGPTNLLVPGYDKPITFGQIYDISYEICNQNKDITVSTTRPETILGDVAIAVNPNDERYLQFHGKPFKAWHPFRREVIPIIFDESIDMEFGTGAVKITPAHDKNDFAIANRHKLECVSVFSEQGKILEDFKDFSNLPRFNARSKIIDALAKLNLYKGVRSHNMSLPICSRSDDVIEYILRPQWFLKCEDMANNAIKTVQLGQLKIHPTSFEQDWFRWLSECKDWCISRQLWWGHQIPAYFCQFEGNSTWIAAESKDDALKKFKQNFNAPIDKVNIQRDSDVLDTWFSSSLLPFSIFGWPKEYGNSYPLDLMETGHDILFFWVARMVMLGQKLTNEIPFRNILLNGIICDSQGRKMSKSLGNVILPEQIIYGASLEELKNELQKSYDNGILTLDELTKSLEGIKKTFPNGIPECGTDALRFTLCSHNIKNHFINFDTAECYTNKLFFNKIWQATRYTLTSCEKLKLNLNEIILTQIEFNDMDKWILSRLGATTRIYNQSIETYNFHIAVNALKNFLYTNLCDVYLETTKPNIIANNNLGKSHGAVLSACLSLALQMMVPFTPFLSEELLQHLPEYKEIIATSFINEELENEFNMIFDVCLAIRQFKSQNEISKKHEPKVHLFPENNNAMKLLWKYKDHIKTISMSNEIILENGSNQKRKNQFNILSTAGHLCSFGITTNEQFAKLEKVSTSNLKKLEKLQEDLNKLLKTISNDGYKKAVRESVKQKHLEKVKKLEIEINNIRGLS